MPTYDYKCDACDHVFEAFQSITAKPLEICPTCGQPQVHRLLTGGIGVIFKGSGFYITDYKNKKSSESTTTDTTSQSTDKKEQ